MPYKDPADQLAWHDRNPDYARNLQLVRSYGITAEQYDNMALTQCGSCAICGSVPCENPEAGRNQKRLHVDHDHVTGEVRGLICSNCNRAIGLLKEDVVIVNRVADYLDR